MKTFLIILLSIFTSTFALAQSGLENKSIIHDSILHKFVDELANVNRATDIILSQQIIVSNPSAELYDYLEVSLEEIRLNLQYKNIEDLEFVSFNKMPSKRLREIDTENLNTDNIYFIQHKGKHVIAVYLEDNKIASFTLVSKGKNKAQFIFY